MEENKHFEELKKCVKYMILISTIEIRNNLSIVKYWNLSLKKYLKNVKLL